MAGNKIPGTEGLRVPGNINLRKQHIIVNPDGTYSTVRSIGIGTDQGEVLIPTTAHDGSRVLSNEEAIKQYQETGKHLGIFKDPASSDAYGTWLHENWAKVYDIPTPPPSVGTATSLSRAPSSLDTAIRAIIMRLQAK